MNVLIVASWFPTVTMPVAGIFIAEQARALATQHEVTVLAPEVGGQRHLLRCVSEDSRGFRVVRVAIRPRRFIFHLAYAWSIVREIRAGQFDLVHAHVTLPAGFAAVVAGLFTGKPVVVTEHRSPFDAFMQRPVDRFKVRFALSRAAAVIPTNLGLELKMRRYGVRRPTHIVRNNIDTELFACRPMRERRDGRFRLIFVGRLNDDQKNLPGLLRALAHLQRAQGERYLLKVIGGGELQPSFEKLATDLGIRNACEFVGTRDKREIARSLAESDVFVLSSFHENCPSVVAEAQAVGRPVVVTRCGGAEEMITQETGRTVPVGDDLALAEAIVEVCSNLDAFQPERIALHAKTSFGDEAIVRQLTEIYDSVLRGQCS